MEFLRMEFENEETSNNEHRTLNIERFRPDAFSVRRSMFVVRCFLHSVTNPAPPNERVVGPAFLDREVPVLGVLETARVAVEKQ